MFADFEDIPECVWELFDEIMWNDPANRGKERVKCSNRGSALIWAWGSNPPLLEHGSETAMTPYGLAAFVWRKEHQQKGGSTKPKNKPGRNSDFARDKKIADEYAAGLESAQWDGQTDYLRKMHAARAKKNLRNAKSWLSQLLARVKKAKEKS